MAEQMRLCGVQAFHTLPSSLCLPTSSRRSAQGKLSLCGMDVFLD